jgi:hypothetical protein
MRGKIKIINLTPHAIVICYKNGEKTEIQSTGLVRVTTFPGLPVGAIYKDMDGLLYASPTYGEVEGLPPRSRGTIYIVSTMVAQHCIGRPDVFSPGTGPNDNPIRENGKIVAVTRLIRAPMS